MTMIAKYLEHVFPQELGPFPKESSLFPREVGFSPGNNHAPREKEFKLPHGAT
jgi:hypothetical protein